MLHLVGILAVLAIGFGLGRTKHADNLIAAVKKAYAYFRSKL